MKTKFSKVYGPGWTRTTLRQSRPYTGKHESGQCTAKDVSVSHIYDVGPQDYTA